ncbi:hypothetical protein LPB41_07325 [Thalassospira sp. MA62]|nr:hypothetical protein [Thalassospira sp. MA62]
MSLSNETLRALYGTWRIARGDAKGLSLFEYSIPAFWRSFFAMLIVFPAFAFLRWTDLLSAPDDFPVGRYMLVETIGYVIKWFAFPVVMYHVIPMIGRAERYVAFITVYNWSSVLQMAVYLVALLLGLLFPMLGAGGFAMIAVVAMLVYGVYIARLTLSVPIATAGALVLADFLLSLVITSVGIRIAVGQLF